MTQFTHSLCTMSGNGNCFQVLFLDLCVLCTKGGVGWPGFKFEIPIPNLSNASFPLTLLDPRARRALTQPLRRIIISHPPTPCTTSPPAEEQSYPPLSVMWRGKRKKSPNQHGTRSLLDIFPVRATINASGSAKSSNGKVSNTKTKKANTNGWSD